LVLAKHNVKLSNKQCSNVQVLIVPIFTFITDQWLLLSEITTRPVTRLCSFLWQSITI